MSGVLFLSSSLFGMGCPALKLAGLFVYLGLSVETTISGRDLSVSFYMGLVGFLWSIVRDLDPPPQRLRPYTQLEHQDPSSHMDQKKRKR